MAPLDYNVVEINPEKLDFWGSQLDISGDFKSLIQSYEENPHNYNAKFSVVYDRETSEVLAYNLCLETEDSVLNFFKAETSYHKEEDVFEKDDNTLHAYKEDKTVKPLAMAIMDGRRTYIFSEIDFDSQMRQYQYIKRDEKTLGELLSGENREFKENIYRFFDLDEGMVAAGYEPEPEGFLSQFKEYLHVIKEEPEYAVLQVGKIMRRIGQGLVQGSLVGVAMSMGVIYGVVGLLAATQQLGRDQVEAISDSYFGKYVDKAMNSDNPKDALKAPYGLKSLFCAASGVATYLMQPEILGSLSNPAAALVGLFITQQATDALEDALNDKVGYAVREELIKNNEKMIAHGHDKHFYQIKGTEDMITKYARIIPFIGSALATGALFATGGAVSSAAFGIASVGLPMWAIGNLLWYSYRGKPDIMLEFEAEEYMLHGDGYTLDSGWDIEFKTLQGDKIQPYTLKSPKLMRDNGKLKIPLELGDEEWGVLLKYKEEVADYTENKSFINKMPEFIQKMAYFKEKERWTIGDGDVEIRRYSTDKYKLIKYDSNTYAFGTEGFIEHLLAEINSDNNSHETTGDNIGGDNICYDI